MLIPPVREPDHPLRRVVRSRRRGTRESSPAKEPCTRPKCGRGRFAFSSRSGAAAFTGLCRRCEDWTWSRKLQVICATIYMVRHGRAAAGFGEHADPGLDDVGREQAARRGWQSRRTRSARRCRSTRVRWPAPARPRQPLAARWGVDVAIESRVAEIPSPTDDLRERARWLAGAMGWTLDGLASRSPRVATGHCRLPAWRSRPTSWCSATSSSSMSSSARPPGPRR